MKYDSKIHHRRSVRLKNYDYSQTGMYFITVCSNNKENIFGNILGETMVLNEIGKIVLEEWLKSEQIRKEIELDEFIIMPNHIHAVVGICNDTVNHEGEQPFAPTMGMKSRSLPSLLAGFKSSATNRINIFRNMPGAPVWQRNYFEHIIRNEKSLDKIRQYIFYNPAGWQNDIENGDIYKDIIENDRKNYYKNILVGANVIHPYGRINKL